MARSCSSCVPTTAEADVERISVPLFSEFAGQSWSGAQLRSGHVEKTAMAGSHRRWVREAPGHDSITAS